MLFNRIYDGVMKKIAEGSALSQRAAKLALGVARQRNALREKGARVPWWLGVQFALADKVREDL
jgi:hypothetical protein